MTLAAQMVSDVTDVFLNTSEHAETISYTATGGSPANITAIVNIESDIGIQSFQDGETKVRTGQLFIATADAGSIARGDTFTISTEAWKVENTRPDRFGMTRVDITRIESVEKSGRNYRIDRG